MLLRMFLLTPRFRVTLSPSYSMRRVNKAQMQQVAVEFGYSETTFVLPPDNPSSTARVRIFTPSREIPFAGHPNVGTAYVLAYHAAMNHQRLPETLHFEEIAGLVPVRSCVTTIP
jgi:trans-2,3-dihydro-3-hydroxyanthranilate isomerase